MNNTSLQNKNIWYAIGLIAFLLIIIFLFRALTSNQSANSVQQPAAENTPSKQQTLNKSYQFPITDANGKVVSTLTYTVQDAKTLKQILIQGRTATAVQGKEFLVIDIKITNKSNNNIQINSSDYVRLSTDKKVEWLASDVNNDPVQVSAISTKYTRLGFTINQSDEKNLILQVGEIKGTKDEFSLKLK